MNDSWPVVSWSGIDYYGNWKALHYQAKRAFAPVHINPLLEGDNLCVYLLSDHLDTREKLTLEMRRTNFAGKKAGRTVVLPSLTLPANTSQCISGYFAYHFVFSLQSARLQDDQRHCFMQLTLKDKSGHTVAETVHFF